MLRNPGLLDEDAEMAVGAYIGVLLLLLSILAASFPITQPKLLDKRGIAIGQSPPSFIDVHEILDAETSKNYNSGLGKESLLYVDDDIIIVNKPTACSTAPGLRDTDSLATRIASTFRIDRIDKMIVHRLDYATSGLVVFARNDNALSELHTQFRLRNKVYKQYSAIVKGCLNHFEGEIDLPLAKDMNCPPLCKVDQLNGKDSFTTWTLFGRNNGKSHVHLRPHTGRTHQLRIHMASIGHPILGDLFYAPKDVYAECSRLLLHAEELRITHPRTNKAMQFLTPCPFSLYDD